MKLKKKKKEQSIHYRNTFDWISKIADFINKFMVIFE